MNCYLATWTWSLSDGRRQEITMTFWANDTQRARQIAHQWFSRVEPTQAPADFSLTDLSHERVAL